MSALHLLTFAHRPEAEAFLSYFELEKHKSFDWLYANRKIVIAITGEGIQETLARTAITLGLYPDLIQVVNLGVAGALNQKIELRKIYSVRSVFGCDERPIFKSFLATGDIDLVTSGTRVLSEAPLAKLRAMGQIVDREAWGVAFAAKEAGVRFSSCKYISDMAGTIEACEPVKAMALEASESLLNHYLELNTDHAATNEVSLEGFHFTFTQQQELQKLLRLLTIKFENKVESWLKHEKVQELLEVKITPKDRSKELLSFYRATLDRFAASKREKLNHIFAPLKRAQIEVQEVGKAETSDLKVSFSFADQKTLEQRLASLSEFELEHYYRFWRGEDT